MISSICFGQCNQGFTDLRSIQANRATNRKQDRAEYVYTYMCLCKCDNSIHVITCDVSLKIFTDFEWCSAPQSSLPTGLHISSSGPFVVKKYRVPTMAMIPIVSTLIQGTIPA